MQVRGLLHAELERNWVCDQVDYQARADTISQMPHFGSRTFEQASLEMVHKFPRLTGLALRRSVPDKLNLLGAGTQHTVVAENGTVIKINRRSVFMDLTEQHALATESAQDHDILHSFVGNILLAQTTNVDLNPLNLKKRAVQHIQKRVVYESLNIFPAYGRKIKLDELDSLTQRVPGIDKVLDELARSGLKMFRERSMVPDVSGPDNLVLTGQEYNQLVCLDGLPVKGTVDPKGTERIATLLRDLRFKL